MDGRSLPDDVDVTGDRDVPLPGGGTTNTDHLQGIGPMQSPTVLLLLRYRPRETLLSERIAAFKCPPGQNATDT